MQDAAKLPPPEQARCEARVNKDDFEFYGKQRSRMLAIRIRIDHRHEPHPAWLVAMPILRGSIHGHRGNAYLKTFACQSIESRANIFRRLSVVSGRRLSGISTSLVLVLQIFQRALAVRGVREREPCQRLWTCPRETVPARFLSIHAPHPRPTTCAPPRHSAACSL